MTSEYMTGQGRYREESRVVRKRRGRTASRGGIGIVLLLMLLLSGMLLGVFEAIFRKKEEM